MLQYHEPAVYLSDVSLLVCIHTDTRADT